MTHHCKTLLLWGVTIVLLFQGCTPKGEKPLYDLRLSENGVGPLDPATPYDAAAVTALLPGFDVIPMSAFAGTSVLQRLCVRYKGAEWLFIAPDPSGERIGSITVVSPHIQTKPLPGLDSTFPAIDTVKSSFVCDNNSMNTTHIECRTSEASRIVYRFEPVDTREGASWHINEIRWEPHAKK